MEAREGNRASTNHGHWFILWLLLARSSTVMADLGETNYELSVAKEITKECFQACLRTFVQRHLSYRKATRIPHCGLLHPIDLGPRGNRGRRGPVNTGFACSATRGLGLPHAATPMMLLPFLKHTAESVWGPQMLNWTFSICKCLQRRKIRKGDQRVIKSDAKLVVTKEDFEEIKFSSIIIILKQGGGE